MNMYNAARSAGYSHNTATKAGSRLETKMTSLCDWMERQGLTDKKLALFLLEALEANKVVGYLHQYKKGEKGRIEKIGTDEVISNEFLEVPDMTNRLKAAELIMKAKGQLKEKVEHSGKVEGELVKVYIQNNAASIQDRKKRESGEVFDASAKARIDFGKQD